MGSGATAHRNFRNHPSVLKTLYFFFLHVASKNLENHPRVIENFIIFLQVAPKRNMIFT